MASYEQFATVYDKLMADMPYKQWIEFAKQVWSRYGAPQRIVDLGCGTGTIAIPLASEGLHVTGIDLSDHMLNIAREKWKHRSMYTGQLELVQQNMCNWRTDEKADSVLSFCDSLNYLIDEDELLSAFQATYDGLRDGGTFLFDMHSIATFEEYAEEQPFVYDTQDVSYLWVSDYDHDEHIIEHHITIFVADEDGRYNRIDEVHIQKAYSEMWLKAALQEVGFREVIAYSDSEHTARPNDVNRLFFVAVK